MAVWQEVKRYLTADEKATVSSIIGLAGAATEAAVGGSMADVAQRNQVGHTAIDYNALRNSKGKSKLSTQEKILNEKLKKAGVQSADDYQRKYDACKTDQCRIQVEKEYLKASDEANKIILNLYMTGQITEEESKILLTSYANKMMRGAGESQRRFGSRIFDLNANEWISASVIGNADFNQITMLNLVKKMKRSGASDEQIAIRVFQYQIAGSYIGSVSIMQQHVDTLLNSGVSVETVIRALSMKKGRRLTNDEIGLIKNRYSVMMQKQGSKAKAGKGTSANSLAGELTGITQKQLDKKFKHAADFGITTTKKNPETLGQYETAIKNHMGDSATKPQGTYGFVKDSKVFFNSSTNNAIVLDSSGNFVTGFKLTPGTAQYDNYMKNGVLR